jgi:hypothetical protein
MNEMNRRDFTQSSRTGSLDDTKGRSRSIAAPRRDRGGGGLIKKG